MQIETTWRPAKEQRPGVLPKHGYRELSESENPDAEPSCPSVRTAMIVYGRHAGTTLTVCTDTDCPVHDPRAAARRSREEEEHPSPMMAEPEPEETEEQATERIATDEEGKRQHYAEEERRTEERRQRFEAQQKTMEAAAAERDNIRKQREAAFERILANAPASFSAAQLRTFLRLLLNSDTYNFLEDAAAYFAGEDEDREHSDEDILLAVLAETADGKLTSFALRLVLTGHLNIPRENEPDFLAEAEAAFLTQPKQSTARKKQKRAKPIQLKANNPKPKKGTAAKKKLAA